MFREELGQFQAMLFVYERPQPVAFWMKNTLIPLDMLFIDARGKIVAIAENARPGSLRMVGPGFAVASVLELNGGLANELGIKPGDTVEYAKLFANGG